MKPFFFAAQTCKKEGCLPTTQSFHLTLKSNTMKNTVQKYCFFAI